MLGAMPSPVWHERLVRHDVGRGQGKPWLGVGFDRLYAWMIQGTRDFAAPDVVVSGSNPLLGAISAVGAARMGMNVVWTPHNGPDRWDWVLTGMGAHDDLLAAAGLPGAGLELFEELARRANGAKGRLLIGWDMALDYTENGISFFSRDCARGWSAQRQREMHNEARRAFSKTERLPARKSRWEGSKKRDFICFCERVELCGGEFRDGCDWVGANGGTEFLGVVKRRGSAAWAHNVAEEFARKSRSDIMVALSDWGWTD